MARKKPGIFIDEIPQFRQVVEATPSLPLFIGYTEKAPVAAPAGERMKPVRIKSFTEYIEKFGASHATDLAIKVITDPVTGNITEVSSQPVGKRFFMHEAVRLFYANGGRNCLVCSVGDYTQTVSLNDLIRPLIIKMIDPGCLIVSPEASLLSFSDYGMFVQEALTVCSKVDHTFFIGDLMDPARADQLRAVTGLSHLKYGAVYTPALTTSYRYTTPGFNSVLTHSAPDGSPMGFNGIHFFDPAVPDTFRAGVLEKLNFEPLPPSAAVVGQYVSNDLNKGIWKAPANLPLSAVWGVTTAISEQMQDTLNVDPVSGKSINAIRAFTGRGLLIWGARTLAGIDLEWRYVPVVRLSGYIRQSLKQSLEFVVFEPNDANTWARVKGMTENFFSILWRHGAFMGAKPEQAYFVRAGLHITMSAQDILEGKLILEYGFAPLRPAEFIVGKITFNMVT